jgi:thioester reductase-like protein
MAGQLQSRTCVIRASYDRHTESYQTLIRLAKLSSNLLHVFGALGNWRSTHPDKHAPKVAVEDPSIPLPDGYSASKWICERLLDSAREISGVSSAVLRIGQIAGPVNVTKGQAWDME